MIPSRRKPHPLNAIAHGMPRLNLTVNKYRISEGNRIIGNFSNLALAFQQLDKHPKATLSDVSMVPSRVIFANGRASARLM